MSRIVVVGEDDLCRALGERLVSATLPGWTVQRSISTGGVTKLWANLPRYHQQAKLQPVLCIADTDTHCAKQLLQEKLPSTVHSGFLLRLAVKTAESWVLADKTNLARFLDVPLNKIPDRPDALDQPKQTVLKLAGNSRKRLLRDEMVSLSDKSKQGTGYNLHLTTFVREAWCVEQAASCSASLARALPRIQALNADANGSGASS